MRVHVEFFLEVDVNWMEIYLINFTSANHSAELELPHEICCVAPHDQLLTRSCTDRTFLCALWRPLTRHRLLRYFFKLDKWYGFGPATVIWYGYGPAI